MVDGRWTGVRRVVVTGPADVDVAWQRYACPQLWARCAAHIREVRCTHDRLQSGMTGVVVGPMRSRVRFEVIVVDPPTRSWQWRVHAGPVTVTMWHDLSASESGTRAGLTMHGPLVLLAAYLPVARRAD